MSTQALPLLRGGDVVDLLSYRSASQLEAARAEAREALRLAVVDVLQACTDERLADLPESELAAELTQLAEAIQAGLSGDDWKYADLEGTPLRQRLLGRLRSHLIRRWSFAPPTDPEFGLTILTAIERVQDHLEAAPSRDDEASLSGPDGLELISEIAHDLRSPLTSILTLAEILRRGQSGAVNEIQRRQLGLIYSAALALSTTASDVMELARGGTLLGEEPSPLSVSQIFDSVRDIVQPMAEEKGIEIRMQLPGIDRRRGYGLALSRVLLNLTANSLKFTSQGFVELGARETAPNRLEFFVRDTGPGISTDALSTLYQAFRREPGRSGYYFSGTGLGLAICRKLVQAMGSQLTVETSADWGTRLSFEVDVPPAADLP